MAVEEPALHLLDAGGEQVVGRGAEHLVVAQQVPAQLVHLVGRGHRHAGGERRTGQGGERRGERQAGFGGAHHEMDRQREGQGSDDQHGEALRTVGELAAVPQEHQRDAHRGQKPRGRTEKPSGHQR